MRYPVDLSLFDDTLHSPSLLALQRSMGQTNLRLVDFCIPVNPYFPTAAMFAEFRDQLETVLKYYPSPNDQIACVLAETFDLDPDAVVMGNGSTELISWIDLLMIRGGFVVPVPTFGRWIDQPRQTGKPVHLFPLTRERRFRLDVDDFIRFVRSHGATAAVLCNPNNPTGTLISPQEVARLCDALSDLDVLVIDESFIDFAQLDRIPTVAPLASRWANVVVLKSLGKNCGLHGVRAGYAVAHPTLASRLRRALPPWNVNALAEMLIRTLARHLSEYELGRRRAVRDRTLLEQRLREVPQLQAFPSSANFVYVAILPQFSGSELRNRLLTEFGILVRDCGNKAGSDDHHFRIAARPADQVDLLIDALRAVSSNRRALVRQQSCVNTIS